MGVADREFTSAHGSGRIHLYDNGGTLVQGITSASDLLESASAMQEYSQILMPCASGSESPEATQNLVLYTNAGGRAFLTDLMLRLLYKREPFASALDFGGFAELLYLGTATGVINTSFAQGREFADWLAAVGALTSLAPPSIQISDSYVRVLSTPANQGAQTWITTNAPVSVQHFSINMPLRAPEEQVCGRLLYSDFHVVFGSVENTSAGTTFPQHCETSMSLTGQEKVLEYMLLDVAACIRGTREPAPAAPPPPPHPPVTPPPVESCSAVGGSCTVDVDCCSGAGNCVNKICTPVVR